MTELVERLRRAPDYWKRQLIRDAATRIEELEADLRIAAENAVMAGGRIAELEKALREIDKDAR